MSNDTVFRLLSEGGLKRVNTRLKPLLSWDAMIKRLMFVLAKVNPVTLQINPLYNVVMIDEKFFNQDTNKRAMYLTEGENPPQRHCRNKRFIGSTMFLAAVARPMYCMIL